MFERLTEQSKDVDTLLDYLYNNATSGQLILVGCLVQPLRWCR